MHTSLRLRSGAVSVLSALFLLATSATALAQVSVSITSGEVSITNKGYQVQKVVRSASQGMSAFSTEAQSGWMVMDNVGNTFEVGSYLRGRDVPDPDPVIVVGGYQRGRDVPDPDPVIVVGGYQEVLKLLVSSYGATVEHDADLNVDLVSFPDQADPIAYFFEIITSVSHNGRLLVDYFRLVEIASKGDFGVPVYPPAPSSGVLPFPNDTYFLNEWNLVYSRLLEARWFPMPARKAVRLAIIDSGVGSGDQSHAGLDGLSVRHVNVAPTTDLPGDHALGLLTLLADRANDGDGIVGLLGSWSMNGCSAEPTLFASMAPQVTSYNVGDFGPISVYVARAIQKAVADGADVINLSLALAYSPTVEEAIRAAQAKGIIVVAAAGNYAASAASKQAKFPANMEGVISVGAAGKSMAASQESANLGVDILAPGEGVIVGGFGGAWYSASGTSYAAPHVAATVAVMRALKPEVKPSEVLRALVDRSQKPGKKNALGFLNALSSINQVLPARDRTASITLPLGCLMTAFGKDSPDFPTFVYDASVDRDLFAASDADALPENAAIEGNYPNPFNPSTVIRFALPEATVAGLSVYNLLGQEVATLVDGRMEAGAHEVRFEAGSLPSGIYMARLSTATATWSRPMMLVR